MVLKVSELTRIFMKMEHNGGKLIQLNYISKLLTMSNELFIPSTATAIL